MVLGMSANPLSDRTVNRWSREKVRPLGAQLPLPTLRDRFIVVPLPNSPTIDSTRLATSKEPSEISIGFDAERLFYRSLGHVHECESRSLDRPWSSALVENLSRVQVMALMKDRLAKAMEVRGVSARDIYSRKILSKAGIYFLLDGTTTPEKVRDLTISALCSYLRINPEWLRHGKGAMDAVVERTLDWPDVLAYRQAASMGDGVQPDEYAETHALKFRAQSLQRKRLRPNQLGICYGTGDSMLPRIRSGDAIMFDMSDTEPKDDALFVISYDGDLLAKKLIEIGGRWHIESLNKDDPKWRKPRPIDEFKQFQIHGRVRWIGSWED